MTFKNTTDTGYISYGNNLSDIGEGSFGIATKTTNSTTDLKLVIQKEGNVGIGLNPSDKLHVIGNANIDGTLTASNLNIIGETTQINTTKYESENLQILNEQSDGPSLHILQNNNFHNIIDTSNLSTDKKFIVDKDGLVNKYDTYN